MPRKRMSLLSMLALSAAVITMAAHQGVGQVFIGTPTPPQFLGQGQPFTEKGEWPTNGGDKRFTRYSPLDQINASNFNQLEVAWRFKTDNFGTRSGIQAGGDADHGQGRPLHDRRHAAVGGRARRQDRRADVDPQHAGRPARGDLARGNCPDAAWPTGPTATATIACSM